MQVSSAVYLHTDDAIQRSFVLIAAAAYPFARIDPIDCVLTKRRAIRLSFSSAARSSASILDQTENTLLQEFALPFRLASRQIAT
jgi:hypothetical protein